MNLKLTYTTKEMQRQRGKALIMLGTVVSLLFIFAGWIATIPAVSLAILVKTHIDLCISEIFMEESLRMIVRAGQESDIRIKLLRELQKFEAKEHPLSRFKSPDMRAKQRHYDTTINQLNELVEDRENGIEI